MPAAHPNCSDGVVILLTRMATAPKEQRHEEHQRINIGSVMHAYHTHNDRGTGVLSAINVDASPFLATASKFVCLKHACKNIDENRKLCNQQAASPSSSHASRTT